MEENRGSWLAIAMTIFLLWSLLFFCVRVWAKLRTKQWGLDDWTMLLTLIISVTFQAVLYRSTNEGYGRRGRDLSQAQLDKIEPLLFASQLLYVTGMGICRVAAALFIRHMAHHGPQTKPAFALVVAALLWSVASILALAIRTPIDRPFTVLDGTETMHIRWLAIESGGFAIEAALWALSIHLIWGLQMKTSKRFFIISAFGCRLLVVPLIIIRLITTAPDRNDDPIYTNIVSNIFAAASLQISIIASCVTSLRPFLTAFNAPAYSFNSGATNASGNSKRSPQDPYYKLEILRRVDRSGVISDDSASWRPYPGSNDRQVTAAFQTKGNGQSEDKRATFTKHIIRSSKSKPRKSHSNEHLTLVDPESPDKLVIQRTTEVMVKYEIKGEDEQGERSSHDTVIDTESV